MVFTSPLLQSLPGIRHAFIGRSGGVSRSPYASANLAFHVGDDPALVLANRAGAAETVGLPLATWVCAEQVHGHSVARVGTGERGRGAGSQGDENAAQPGGDALPATDGLVSSDPGVTLVIFTADCVPVFLAIPGEGVGAAHAGWQGTAAGIAARTAAALGTACGAAADAVHAWIGPSIGPCCYAVDADRAGRFRRQFGAEVIRPGPGGRGHEASHLDLWEANRRDLIAAGVPAAQIEVAGLCTACCAAWFFSYRRERTTGRMAALIARAGEGRS